LKVNGVVGSSILRKIPFFDLVINCSLESMHSCWEGVTAQLMDLWTDTKNHKQDWYIGSPKNLAELNAKWKQIQVPQSFRVPIPLEMKNIWKGIVLN
jgi:hypothetical protein